MLLGALADAKPPAGLEEEDEQFRRGLGALAEVLEQTLRAIDAHDDDEVARLHGEQHEAGVDVNDPLGAFNQELETDLRSH